MHARVQAGWVMLEGEVEWDYQRHEVERMVRNVRGVVGITNNILVKPRVSADQIEAKIEEAFKREAEVDARHIRVEVSDHTAKLYGHVHSLNEANAASVAAAAAPGVSGVESHLVVLLSSANSCQVLTSPARLSSAASPKFEKADRNWPRRSRKAAS